MATNTEFHPPGDQLKAFCLGELSGEEALAIERHLGECKSCCETLGGFKDDTFVEHLRDAMPLVDAGKVDSLGDLSQELREHSRYHVIEMIGKGGMGAVYRAEHRLMQRMVAIKVINARYVQHPQAVERFRREAQAAAKLAHPNIVTAYDAEQAGDAHFLVMEFVAGADLASTVLRNGPMSIATACDCIGQAALGLQHAHEKGMVHRDIKPQNLMLANGTVRILDFGLASFAVESVRQISSPQQQFTPTVEHEPKSTSLTQLGTVMGTPDYMAPEQAADAHSADIRADIYSLGCTLYYLLTGRAPFAHINSAEKLAAHARMSPPDLATLRKEIPKELTAVSSRMLAKDPNQRFQTPAELFNALAPFTRKTTSIPRRIAIATAAVIALIASITMGVLIYVQMDKGQFTIEADKDVAVLIENSSITIRDTKTGREYRLKAGEHPIRSGDYQIQVSELPAGIHVNTERFEIKGGGKARVRVTFEPAAPKVAFDDKNLSGEKKKIVAASEAFLKLMDDGKFDELWGALSKLGQKASTQQRFADYHKDQFSKVGRAKSRRPYAIAYLKPIASLPPGNYAAVRYRTNFEHLPDYYEAVILNLDEDGEWRVNAYVYTAQENPLPEKSE